MPMRSLRWRGFGVSVEIPEGVAARLPRPLRQRTATADNNSDRGALVFADPPPDLELRKHPPEQALDFFNYPEHDAVATGIVPDDYRFPLDVARALADGEMQAEDIAAINWYHNIELPNGLVTPGYFDHRPLVPFYGLPDDLTGRRALDVATYDGFWAFEFERRGAEVVAIDIDSMTELDYPAGAREHIEAFGIDFPIGRGFALAHRLLGSKVERVACNVYELDPETLGSFDLVHVGDLLLHLRDPVLALQRIRSVTRGQAHIVDVVDPHLPNGGSLSRYQGAWSNLVWWTPSVQVLAQMVLDAGFSRVDVQRLFDLDGDDFWRVILAAEP